MYPSPLTAILLTIILVAFGLRLFRLEDANIWWDEGLAVWAARMPLSEMAAWTAADVHPPLYFAVLHFWQQVAGENEFAARFLSVAFGTLTVAALWQLGRVAAVRWPWVALGGALLLALSRFGVWWSQEARMYVLGGLLCTLSLLFTLLLRRRFTPARVAGYLIVTTLALWTLYLLAFLLIIEGLYWLWSLRAEPDGRQRWRLLARWAVLAAAVLVLFLPWLLYTLPRLRSWSVQTPFDARFFAQLYATLLTFGVSTDIDALLWPVVSIITVLMLGLLALLWRRRQPVPESQTHRSVVPYATLRHAAPLVHDGLVLLLLAVLIPPLVVWLLTALPRGFGYSPKPEARYLLPYAPSFYLLAAWGLAGLSEIIGRRVRSSSQAAFLALLALLAAVQVWSLTTYYRDRFLSDDYISVAQTLNAHVRADDSVLLHTDQPWPVFAFHYHHPFSGTPNAQEATADGVDSFLRLLWEGSEALWLVVNEDALRADKDRLYEGWLAQQAAGQQEWRLGDKRVIAFARTPERATTLTDLAPGFTPPQAAYLPPPSSLPLQGPAGQLAGWEQPLQRLRGGEPAHVAAYIANPGAGRVTLALGDPPLAQTEVEIAMVSSAPGATLVRVPMTLVPPLVGGAGWQPWRLSLGADAETVGWVQLVDQLRTSTAESIAPQIPLTATFGDPPLAQLLGYDIVVPNTSDPNTVGAPVALTLYWQVMNPTVTSYKVFTHLTGPDGRPAAQGDDFPVHGERPTTTWQPGESLVDVYNIPTDIHLPAGHYPLKIGFYDPVTGVRLPVRNAAGTAQADDQMVLTEVEIR